MSSATQVPPTHTSQQPSGTAIPGVPQRMKAAVYTAYGAPETIELRDVEVPVPAADEVLIRIRAAALNPLDWRILRGGSVVFRLMFGFRTPNCRPGRDVAGEIVALGKDVTRWKVGDRVFGVCIGAVAEYVCARASKIARMPDGITFEQAASIPVAGITALQGLRDYGVQTGSRVLINGAAGGVGTFAVQIAKWLGARVTAVCSSKNVEMVRSLGADRVIDYTQQDVTAEIQRFDVILENVGNLPLSACKHLLQPWGRAVMAGAPKKPWHVIGRILSSTLYNAMYLSMRGRRVFHTLLAKIGTKDLEVIADLIERGQVKPIIDRVYPMDKIAGALAYLETGHAPGKVIINP